MQFYSFFKNLFSKPSISKPKKVLSGVELADVIFYNLVAEEEVPGISVTISKEGKVVLQKGYGYSNLEEKLPVDPRSTLFRIASISKCITALAFGKMVEEGILNWDDSFYKHVSDYPKKQYDFTLRQLASHTAGIRGYRGKEFALNKPFSIKESIEFFKDDPLVFEPGKGYLYNSLDFVLLSLAMQEASGIPFEDYVQEKILMPLGMKCTFPPLGLAEPVEAFNTEFYTKSAKSFKKAIEVNNFYKLAGGGYLSTSNDIAKLGRAVLERKLLKSETYRQLLTSEIIKGNYTYYGLGFQVSQDTKGRPFVGHVGNSVGAYSNFYVFEKEKTVISVLINSSEPTIQKDLDSAIEEVLSNSKNIST